MDKFNDRMKRLRKNKGLSQQNLADLLKVSQVAVAHWESGNREPNIDTIIKLSKYFNVSVDWLLGASNDTRPSESSKTFSDVIRLLFQIETSYLEISIFCGHTLLGGDYASIRFEDPEMVEFMQEWEGMRILHHEKTIDDDMYDLWKRKILEKYKETVDFIDQDD